MSDAEMRAPRPAPVSGAEQGTSRVPVPCQALTRSDEILKMRLAADDKYVRRIAKRLTMVASARNGQERYVAARMRHCVVDQAQGVGHASSRDGLGVAARTYRAPAVDRIRHGQYGACTVQARSGPDTCVWVPARLGTDRPESLRAKEQERVEQLREELKTALETQRHRLEYENLAQKIIVYPSREEMEGYVS